MTFPYYIQSPIKDENNTEINALNLYRIIIIKKPISVQCSMKIQWNFVFLTDFPLR